MANFFATYSSAGGGGGGSGSNASVGLNGQTAPLSSTEVAGQNPSGNLQPLQTDNSGNLLVSITSEPGAPFATNLTQVGGAAISEGQKTMAASLPVAIASDQSTLPISASALPLPTGASTSALQTTGNTSLASIDGKTPALGQALMAASTPIAIASNQSSIPVTLASVPLPTGAATAANQTNGSQESQIVQGGNTATVSAAGALKVDGSAVTQPVSAASLPLPTGAATSANQTNASQKSQIVDGSGNVIASTSNALNVSVQGTSTVNAKPATPAAGTVTQAALTVGTTAVRLTVSASAPSAVRQKLVVIPDPASTALFYVGSSTVTNSGATRGIPLQPGQPFEMDFDAADYFIISNTAAQTVFIMETA